MSRVELTVRTCQICVRQQGYAHEGWLSNINPPGAAYSRTKLGEETTKAKSLVGGGHHILAKIEDAAEDHSAHQEIGKLDKQSPALRSSVA
jgi:hypothetical protein